MADIVAFLKARLDEDAAAARKAKPGPWHADGSVYAQTRATGQAYADEVVDYAGDSAEHIARHDPARVLADVEAKRRIVELHADTFVSIWWPEHEACEIDCCKTCSGGENVLPDDAVESPCETLKLLALPFTDHSDYDESWRLRI